MSDKAVGVRPCTSADIEKVKSLLPPEFHQYLVGKCEVEVCVDAGMCCYQGWDDVVHYYYRINIDCTENSHTKIFPCLTSRYNGRQLSQVHALVNYP